MTSENPRPFAELPESLVDEMLSKTEHLSKALSDSLKQIYNNKVMMRASLESSGFLQKDIDETFAVKEASTCGIDGSFVIENLLSTDLVAGAAVSIEGFIPPGEERPLSKPKHMIFIEPEKHDPNTGSIIRGLVMEMEAILAAESLQQIVLLDGSFTSRLIQVNQAINASIKVNNKSKKLTATGNELVKHFEEFLRAYKTILRSSNPERIWASVPKLTSLNEIGKKMRWDEEDWYKGYDDRAILTAVLAAGEFTRPLKLASDVNEDKNEWHLKIPDQIGNKYNRCEQLIKEIALAINDLHVFYYKPYDHCPAMRIETGSSNLQTDRFAKLLQAIKYQSSNSTIMEPYPLYMADRMAKHLPMAVPAFKQIVTQYMATSSFHDSKDIFFSMHNYRTESGM